jgi:predicted transcriptional regulator
MKISRDMLLSGREENLERELSVPSAIQTISREPIFVQSEANRKSLSRRSQLEIRMDMLAAVKEGAEKPTQIMYKANLSWVALQTHLTQLLERGLLKWATDGNRKKYELTIKGANVMYSYVKILEEIGEDTTDYMTVGT